MRANRPFEDGTVASVFDSYPEPHMSQLLVLRALIFDVAESSSDIGELKESLKWGAPSYVPTTPRTGSPVRLGIVDANTIAIYFNCNTSLVNDFRLLFLDALAYSGNRAVILRVNEPLPQNILVLCIEQALRYHLRSRV